MKGKTQSVYKRDEKLSKALLGLWTFSNSYTSESNDLLNQQSQKANSVCLEVNGISMEKDLIGRKKVQNARRANEGSDALCFPTQGV